MIPVLASLGVYAAAFLALLLLASAAHKLSDPRRMRHAVQGLTGLSGRAAAAATGAAAAFEAVAGLALLWSPTRALAAVSAGLLWAVYLALILRAHVQGRADVDCGCTFGGGRKRVGGGRGQVRRNLVLIGLALFTAQAAGLAPPAAASALEVLAAAGLFTLYVALDHLAALGSAGGDASWVS